MIYSRWYKEVLKEKLVRPYVHLLFGARQTGKSTLLNSILPGNTFIINLSDPAQRSEYSADPGILIKQCKAMPFQKEARYIFIDEAQKTPEIFDSVQNLYDSDKERWRFILCGSSARKLRTTGANLLPGRSFYHRLYPLVACEHRSESADKPAFQSPLQMEWKTKPANLFPETELYERLAFGSLPGIVTAEEDIRGELLKSFAVIHLEEEIRKEALIKNHGAFINFLKLAASESGKLLNYRSISQESRVSQPTIKSYYELLQDMFVGFTVPAFSKSERKNLLSTPKFLFFDLGLRNAAAGIFPSKNIVNVDPGYFLEHWVGIELWKRLRYLGSGKLMYFRTKDGMEIDYIVETGSEYFPIEVKWTTNPDSTDAKHLRTFLRENKKNASKGFIICRCNYPMEIEENIFALPWQFL